MPAPAISQTEKLSTLLSVLMIIIAVAVLYFAKEIFVPLALALLFSFLLAPLVRRFELWRLPRVPAVLLAVALAFSCVGGVGYIVGAQLVDLTYKLPSYQSNISRRISNLKKSDPNSPFSKASASLEAIGNQLAGGSPEANGTRPEGRASDNKDKIRQVEIVKPATSLIEVVQSVLGPAVGPLGTGAVVVVFVLFMLLKREDLRDRIIHLIGKGQLNVTTQALDEAAQKVTGYLSMQVIINVCFGMPIGLGLFFIGVPNAFLWGLLAILLRFIPYVGAWIALGFPLLLSLAVTSTWPMPLEVLGLFASIELVTSNILEPWLYGAHTGLSPVAIMVATIFWTWLWGGVGLLLATPLTVCVAVLGKYIPSLSFLDALLGDEPTLTVNERYYQRLLAMDRHEAGAVAEEYHSSNNIVQIYSDLFVPALAAAEREEQTGSLDERHQRFIFETTREMIEELGSGHAANGGKLKPVPDHEEGSRSTGPVVPVSKYPVLCLPAADEADEIAAIMLAQCLEKEGYKAESFSHKTLANEMVTQVAESNCQTVCISATPPHDTLHTRYLCKLLRSKFPHLHIVVGLWDAEKDEDKLTRRRERLAADKVVTNLCDALDEIRPFAILEADMQPEAAPAPA